MFENKPEKNDDIATIEKVVAGQEIELWGSKSKQSRPPTLPPSSADSEGTGAAVFSSQRSQFADYTTWKGIENKTGIEREHAYDFVLKELLDNAVDYLETQHNTTSAADIPLEIHVIIKKIEL